MTKYVLFDFDGTLADSRKVFISAFNELAAKYGFRKIEAANMEQLKRLSMMQRLRFLEVPLYRVPFLTREFLSLYRLGLQGVSPVPGMMPVLEKIGQMGIVTGIVSSNSVPIIRSFLDTHTTIPITEVHCSNRLFGKERVLRSFLKRKKLQGSQVLYVCDELRDIIACHKAGIKPVWVSWGFETRDALQAVDITYAIDTPAELVQLLGENK